MKRLREWISFLSLLMAVVLGTAGGISLAVFSQSIPAVAAFQGEILVSWRGGGDNVEATPSRVSAPMFYTTPSEGATSDGRPGERPTGEEGWAPGDTWQRSLVVKNQDPMRTMGLGQLTVTLSEYRDLAGRYTLTVTGPDSQTLYAGTLTDAAVNPVKFSAPIALKPGEEKSFTFTATLERNTTNPLQGRTVKAEFRMDADALTSEIVIDIKPASDPNGDGVGSNGRIPVAINGSATFSVTALDWTTARFGPNQVAPLDKHQPLEDWNGDGFMDLVFHFPMNETGITCDMTSASLTIQSFDGVTFEGTDAIKPESCP